MKIILSPSLRHRLRMARAGTGLVLFCMGFSAWGEDVQLARFPKSANQYIAAQILADVYRKAGLTVSVVALPPARATLEVIAGRIDGEVSRVYTHAEDNPGLVRVEPGYNHFTMASFSKLAIKIESVADLQNYRVGIVRGLKAATDLTAGLPNVEKAVNSETLFLMLAAGHLDVAIDVDINGAFEVSRHQLKGVRNVGTLSRTEAFNYLAQRKAYLQSRVGAAIAELKRTGELDRLKRKYEQRFVELGVEPD